MTKFFALILCSLPFSLFAQPLEYEQVFYTDSNITKDALFNRARSWFVDTYKDAFFFESEKVYACYYHI